MNYTIELDKKRQHGPWRSGAARQIERHSLHRAFPYVIRDESGNIVQYAKTEQGALSWIERQKAVVKQ